MLTDINPLDQPYRLKERNGRGLACDSDGVTLGPITLIALYEQAGKKRYRLAPFVPVSEALSRAFGPLLANELQRRYRTLADITETLNRGDLARATMTALLMRLPEISDDGMAKLAASHLRKYSPDQPRVPAGNSDGGRWTSDGGDDSAADAEDSSGGVQVADGSQGGSRGSGSQNAASTTPRGTDVVLPDGTKIEDSNSSTGYLRSPVADLTPVAEAGQNLGAAYASMLRDPTTADGAFSFLIGSLAEDLGHGGTFDYQRDGNIVSGYIYYPEFTDVSNFNVGLLCEQAGLSLNDALSIAGSYASVLSSNANPNQPYGLGRDQAKWIRIGFEYGRQYF